MKFVLNTIGGAAGLWVSAWLLPGISVTPGTSALSTLLIYLMLGVIFSLLNLLVRPVIKFLSFPLYLLTLGLFSLVVNAIIIGLTGWISSWLHWGMMVSGFWSAVGAGIITSIISSLVIGLLRKLEGKPRRHRGRR